MQTCFPYLDLCFSRLERLPTVTFISVKFIQIRQCCGPDRKTTFNGLWKRSAAEVKDNTFRDLLLFSYH